jgi:helicase
MKVIELCELGIPPELVEQMAKNGMSELTLVQRQAIEAGLLDGENLLIAAPTSSGKTTITELAAISAARNGKKTVYLVTHKALA